MKKLFIKTIGVLVAVLLIAPVSVSAADIHFNDETTVTEMTGDYLVNVQLQISDLTSLTGISLIGIKDDGEINPPFNVMNLSSNLTSAVQSNGNFNLQFVLSMADNPNGSWIQFFIVDTTTLNSMDISDFNPDNNSQFTVFSGTEPWPISYNGNPNGNNDNGQTNPDLPPDFNPAEDCYDILYVDEPECTEYFATGDTVYNPNFALTATLENPLGEDGDIDILTFLASLFKTMIKFMLPILVLFTVYSGFLFVKARGNSDELRVAKQNFLYVVIGAAVVFGAWIIAKVIAGTVEQFALRVVHDIIRLL